MTETELHRKLLARAADESDVNRTIKRLRKVGYLDDARAAESHAYVRREFAGLGRSRVLRELERRGVKAELAEKTVEQAYRGVDEAVLIRDFLRRKLGKRLDQPIGDRKQVLKLFALLQRAGYSNAKIVEALKPIAGESDWLDVLEE